jgi:1-acyl-sn-glycerol-3-phosphate acyltransferase
LLRLGCGALSRALFRVIATGPELPPPPGSIVAGVPHRNWLEPMLMFACLPARPRLVVIADGPTVSRGRLRRWLIGVAGGAIEVQPGAGPSGFEAIAKQAGQVISNGGVVAIFPEHGAPAREPGLRRLANGVANLSARIGAPVVPVIFGGTHELYLRRRVVVRVLAPLDPPAKTDRATTRVWMAHFREVTAQAAVEAHRAAETGSPRRKYWRWLGGSYPRAEV